MPTVLDVLTAKGEQVHSIRPDASVLDAVQKMNQHKIGALIVMDAEQRVAGIFTERDVLRRVLGAGKLASGTRVGDVMTTDVICCEPEADLDEVSAIMKSRRVRHVPVCAPDGRLRGMISIGDVNAAYASNQEATIHFLHEYVFGRA